MAALLWLAAGVGLGQVCRLSVAGLNRARRVLGGVNVECPHPLHSAPFGNWGVTSNFGGKINGHQFDGWCHNLRVCDNRGNCFSACGDGWYEWNSCTDHPDFARPNCTLYNSRDCTEQETNQGINVMSTKTVDVPVRCPLDTNGDGTFDRGGCSDLSSFNPGTNFMSLYELDPLSTDELVQTLYFPDTPVKMGCNVFGCAAAGSDWVQPASFADPPFPPRALAELAAVVNFGNFVDTSRACPATPPLFRSVSAATFLAPGAAPDSIVSAFGFGLASQTVSANKPSFELAGTSLRLADSGGADYAVPLTFVSPAQINYLTPGGARLGLGTVRVMRGSEVVATGALQIESVAPGIFTANSNGSGVPAALILRVSANGALSYEYTFNCVPPAPCVPRPIEIGAAQLYLSLFATGVRGAMSPVTVKIGGEAAEVLYAGPQGQYAGLDQVNVRIPASMAGRGMVDVVLSVDGHQAPPVQLRFL